MNPLQKKILKILIAIHDLCVENDIRYYLGYGTLLGAVRHKGFIPWDDDVDIVMPRQDYDKFIACAEKLPEGYGLLTYKVQPGYMYNFAKVEDKSTSFVEGITIKSKFVAGVYVDIFPLDKVPADEERIKKLWYKQRRLQNFIYSYYTKDYASGNPVIKLAKKLITRGGVQLLHKRLDKMITRYNKKPYDSYFAFPNTFEWIIYREEDLTPRKFSFEGYTFFSFLNAERILTDIYGDYMQLPPEEDRKTHAPYYMDLEHRVTAEELENVIANRKEE